MSSTESPLVRPGQFGWVRRASAVAMARGARRPFFAGGALSDIRMGGVGVGPRLRPDLLIATLFSRD